LIRGPGQAVRLGEKGEMGHASQLDAGRKLLIEPFAEQSDAFRGPTAADQEPAPVNEAEAQQEGEPVFGGDLEPSSSSSPAPSSSRQIHRRRAALMHAQARENGCSRVRA
jgi:hypothetical protein